jgi:hypothetical protein
VIITKVQEIIIKSTFSPFFIDLRISIKEYNQEYQTKYLATNLEIEEFANKYKDEINF